MVKEKYGVTYILTYRVNEDGLKHSFACFRQMGSTYGHPSAVAFKHRIKTHPGKQNKLMGSKYNIATENNDVPMMSDQFSKDKLSTADQNIVNESLQKELSLSAMMLTYLDIDDPDDPYITEGKKNR